MQAKFCWMMPRHKLCIESWATLSPCPCSALPSEEAKIYTVLLQNCLYWYWTMRWFCYMNCTGQKTKHQCNFLFACEVNLVNVSSVASWLISMQCMEQRDLTILSYLVHLNYCKILIQFGSTVLSQLLSNTHTEKCLWNSWRIRWERAFII